MPSKTAYLIKAVGRYREGLSANANIPAIFGLSSVYTLSFLMNHP